LEAVPVDGDTQTGWTFGQAEQPAKLVLGKFVEAPSNPQLHTLALISYQSRWKWMWHARASFAVG